MKTFILGLLILLSLAGKSQRYTDTIQKQPTNYSWEEKAGRELIKATNHYYRGLIVATGGLCIAGLSSAVYALDEKDGSTLAGVYIGGAITLVGTIFMIESHSHIRKAGLIMLNGNKNINLSLNTNGIGISMKF